jgi:hypothetical protein
VVADWHLWALIAVGYTTQQQQQQQLPATAPA